MLSYTAFLFPSLPSSPLAYVVCFHIRREASQAKKEGQAQADVVQALRRDLAGASARMSDMAGELSDKQKQKLEENEERIREQDRELEELKKQLSQLSLLVDEQQRQIEHREVKLNQQEANIVKHHKDSLKKSKQLVEYTDVLEKAVEDQAAQMELIEKEVNIERVNGIHVYE